MLGSSAPYFVAAAAVTAVAAPAAAVAAPAPPAKVAVQKIVTPISGYGYWQYSPISGYTFRFNPISGYKLPHTSAAAHAE